jgi:hypothetical protein
MSAVNPRLIVAGAVTPDAAPVVAGEVVVDFDELQAAMTTVALMASATNLVVRRLMRGTA